MALFSQNIAGKHPLNSNSSTNINQQAIQMAIYQPTSNQQVLITATHQPTSNQQAIQMAISSKGPEKDKGREQRSIQRATVHRPSKGPSIKQWSRPKQRSMNKGAKGPSRRATVHQLRKGPAAISKGLSIEQRCIDGAMALAKVQARAIRVRQSSNGPLTDLTFNSHLKILLSNFSQISL